MIPGRVAFLSSPEKFANFVIKICKISAGCRKIYVSQAVGPWISSMVNLFGITQRPPFHWKPWK